MDFNWLWTTISVIGSIVSIFAAYKSFSAKSITEKISDEVRRVRESIFLRQREGILVELLEKARNTQNNFKKYISKASLQGVDFDNDMNVLIDLVNALNANKTILRQKTDLKVDQIYKDLLDLMNKFSDENIEFKKNLGRSIMVQIHDVIHKVNTSIENIRQYESNGPQH